MATNHTSTGLMLTRHREDTLTRARLAALVACSADAIIGETLDGIITDWNPAAERLYGYRADEVIGRDLMMLIPDDRIAETEAVLARLRGGETIEHFETERWTKDGRRIDVELTLFPVRDETGAMIATSAIVRDVTARKATERALATSEARLRTLVEQLPVGVYLLAADEHATPLYLSPFLEAHMGIPIAEAMARTQHWLTYVHPDDRARVAAADARPPAAGEVFRLEYRHLCGDGRYIWVHDECVPVRDDTGQIIAWQGVLLDITARVEAQAALVASETRFRTAFANAPIGMVLAGSDLQTSEVNKALCDMLGYTEDELRTEFWRVTHPDDMAANVALIESALAGEIETYELEKRYIHKDGRVIWAQLNGSIVRDAEREPRYFISQIQDITERKAAEAEFAATHQHTLDVLERITDGFYALDRDWNFTYLNAAAEAMLGRTRESVIGRSLWELYPYMLGLPTHAAFHDAMATGQTTGVEMLSPNSGRWYDVRAYPSADGLSVFFHDVTEPRRLTEELRASEGKYRALVEQLPVVVYVLAPDEPQTLVYVSPQVEPLFGFTPEEAIASGTHWLHSIHPDDRDRVAAIDALSETSFRAEYRELRKDGSHVWVRDECVPVYDKDGTIVAWQGVLLDISDLIAAEEARAQLAALVESAEDAIVSSTMAGTITSWNRGAERLYGYQPEEIIGQSFLRLLPDDVSDGTLEWRRNAAQSGEPLAPFETTRLRKDGTEVAVSIALSPIRDRYGRIVGVSSITRDVTERKKLEADLREALQAAQAGIRTKTLFLAMMSHELRTPLQAVLGYADFLLNGPAGSLTPEQREDIGYIRQGAGRMVALIEQLLDLSRMEAGRLDLAAEPVELATIIEQVRQDLVPTVTAKGLSFILDVPEDLPPVLGDTVRLRQILLNVVGNAVKFTDAGLVQITAAAEPDFVVVTVHDTGIGIAPQALPFIFEEFRQVDDSRTRRHGGAGLGLAIARRLIEQMGGRISAESEPGAGSTFTLWLPVARH